MVAVIESAHTQGNDVPITSMRPTNEWIKNLHEIQGLQPGNISGTVTELYKELLKRAQRSIVIAQYTLRGDANELPSRITKLGEFDENGVVVFHRIVSGRVGMLTELAQLEQEGKIHVTGFFQVNRNKIFQTSE